MLGFHLQLLMAVTDQSRTLGPDFLEVRRFAIHFHRLWRLVVLFATQIQ